MSRAISILSPVFGFLAVCHSAHLDAFSEIPLNADDECFSSQNDGQGSSCSLNAIQVRRAKQQHVGEPPAMSLAALEVGCHDTHSGEKCYEEILWAKTVGVAEHPEWYPGLTNESSVKDFQSLVHKNGHSCPRPCVAQPTLWCQQYVAPRLWAPAAAGDTVTIKVLSYNLFWWHLFGVQGGNGNSSGHLIKNSMEDIPYDFMGFQECEDPEKVLGPVNLTDHYEALLGTHAICVAYRKAAWNLLEHGEQEVAEDMPTKYYGKRGTQWMRLAHKQTGRTVFFVNHHGPLSVNSGGVCGGQSTANNLLHLMGEKAQVGDVLILVGDFNANAASTTIQSLWPHLVHVYNGDSFGGVDNIFSNVGIDQVVAKHNLGHGGSDHNAVSVEIELGPPGNRSMSTLKQRSRHAANEPPQSVEDLTGDGASTHDWEGFWCGRIEHNVEYSVQIGGWSKSFGHGEESSAPENCCRACQDQKGRCKTFIWKEWSDKTQGSECLLFGGVLTSKANVDGSVSGVTAAVAAVDAAAAAKASMKTLM